MLIEWLKESEGGYDSIKSTLFSEHFFFIDPEIKNPTEREKNFSPNQSRVQLFYFDGDGKVNKSNVSKRG